MPRCVGCARVQGENRSARLRASHRAVGVGGRGPRTAYWRWHGVVLAVRQSSAPTHKWPSGPGFFDCEQSRERGRRKDVLLSIAGSRPNARAIPSQLQVAPICAANLRRWRAPCSEDPEVDRARRVRFHGSKLLTHRSALCHELGNRLVVGRRQCQGQSFDCGFETGLGRGGANGGANGRQVVFARGARFDSLRASIKRHARQDSNLRPAA